MPADAARLARTDSGLASTLAGSVMRLARRLRQERDTDLTASQLSALGTIRRYGPLTIGALAAHERVQPPSMTRTVGCLLERASSTASPHPTDGRQVVVAMTDAGTGRCSTPSAAAVTPGWPAGCGASPRRARPAAPCRSAAGGADRRHEPDVPRPGGPQLPPVRRGRAGVQRRHLDAARRAGLAGAAAVRHTGARSASRPACSSCPCCCCRRSPGCSPTGSPSAGCSSAPRSRWPCRPACWACWRSPVSRRPGTSTCSPSLFGIGTAFDAPARQSFVVEMVGRDDLPTRSASTPRRSTLARIIGPAVAGLLIALLGSGRGHRVGHPDQRGQLPRGRRARCC